MQIFFYTHCHCHWGVSTKKAQYFFLLLYNKFPKLIFLTIPLKCQCHEIFGLYFFAQKTLPRPQMIGTFSFSRRYSIHLSTFFASLFHYVKFVRSLQSCLNVSAVSLPWCLRIH